MGVSSHFADEMEKISAAGHWRKLSVGQKGEDQFGNLIVGRTWVKGEKEFAPGIPAKKKTHEILGVSKPLNWQLVVQHHPAVRARDHLDIRLLDPRTGHAHSWATKKEIPKPGADNIRVYQQPTHTAEYLKFQGPITSGYGKTRPGKSVKKVVDERVEVLQADDNLLRFNVYGKKTPEEFILVRNRKQGGVHPTWTLINVTKTRGRLPKDLPFSKPKYREVMPGAIDLSDESQVMAAKLDGGHVTYTLMKGRRPRIFSYREPKERETGAIEHSQKVESLYHSVVPKELHDTILRGELYARDPSGKKPVPAETVSGMLNAGVWRSRELQSQHGVLRPAIFDVVQYKGKDMTQAGYDEKLKALNEIRKAMPQFEVPDVAITEKEKKALLDAIEKKLHPATHEGVVLWHRTMPEKPTKAKFTVDHDVYIKEVFQEVDVTGRPKPQAGGFLYSLRPDGPVVGRVGTGFSQKLKQDMWNRKNAYVGATAVIRAEKQTKRGALSKPRFQNWHPDKNHEVFWQGEPVAR